MTEEEAVTIVQEVILGEGSVPARIALGRGIDEGAVARLEEAMRCLTEAYSERDTVSKIVAGAFVDLTPMMERGLPLYPEKEAERIFDLKERLNTLALTMFGVE